MAGRGERKDHAPEDDDNRRLCVCDNSEALPDHETRGEDRGEVEDLEEDLRARVGRFIMTMPGVKTNDAHGGYRVFVAF